MTAEKTNESEPLDDVSKAWTGDVKIGGFVVSPRVAQETTCLLLGWRPALRWRELGRGSFAERGNLHPDAKGEFQVEDL